MVGLTPDRAAVGLFGLNVSMLAAFLTWGAVVPRLYARGWTAERFIARGAPLSLAALLLALALGSRAGAWSWALFCVAGTATALAQPAVAQAFPAGLAGRALSAYNLVVFSGVFVLQWGLGVVIDRLRAAQWDVVSAYRGAFALLAGCCLFAYLWFLWRDDGAAARKADPTPPTAHNPPPCPE